MVITDVKYEIANITQTQVFRIAFAEIDKTEDVFVKITTDSGIFGIGEACPFAPVTGETTQMVMLALEAFKPQLIGMDPFDLEGIHAMMDRTLIHNGSSKCAVDIALYDIIGKAMGQPVYKVLGGANNRIMTDVTIGIDDPEVMAQQAKEWVKKGFSILKVKVGISEDDDLRALTLIREAVGPDVKIRVDANQGYEIHTAAKMCREFLALGVDAMEQPRPYWDLEGMAEVRRRSGGMLIMADESLHTPHDALAIAKAGAADILNIKLMKCGGLYPALKINAIAEAQGLHCMVGCMNEERIAITAAMSLVAAQRNITEADCDSFLLNCDCSIPIKSSFICNGSEMILSDEPGLGVEVDF